MKVLRRIGLGILIVLVVLLLVILCRSFTTMPVRQYDQQLQLARVNIPEGSNAFDMLETAAGHLWWPKEQDQQISRLANNTNWDDALAGTVLASNRETLVAWDAAVKMPDMQVPEIPSFEDELPYLQHWKKLALLAQVRENALLHAGHEQEAFDEMVWEIRMGRRMQNAHGVLLAYLVGAAVNSLGYSQMQRWTGQVHLTADQLKDYARQIEVSTDEADVTYANAIRVEYQMTIKMLDDLREGKLTSPGSNAPYPRAWPIWPVFSMSRTKGMFAEGSLQLVKASAHPYGQADIGDFESRPGLTSIFLSGNPVGQILYFMLMPGLANTLEKKSREDVQMQVARIILALRAYELTHGSLPTDLSALVPEFLDKVPTDDYDGQPMRYSAEKKIVYSVGKNLKDDGGDDRSAGTAPTQGHLDLVFKFDF